MSDYLVSFLDYLNEHAIAGSAKLDPTVADPRLVEIMFIPTGRYTAKYWINPSAQVLCRDEERIAEFSTSEGDLAKAVAFLLNAWQDCGDLRAEIEWRHAKRTRRDLHAQREPDPASSTVTSRACSTQKPLAVELL